MKQISLILGYIMLLLTGAWGLFYWTAMFGGIGFFGALLTTPASEGIAVILNMFSSVVNFISWVFWFVTMIIFISYGADDKNI